MSLNWLRCVSTELLRSSDGVCTSLCAYLSADTNFCAGNKMQLYYLFSGSSLQKRVVMIISCQ